MYANMITLVSHVLVAYILVQRLEMRLKGVAVAMAINYVMRFGVLQVLISRSPFSEHLLPFRLDNLLPQLRLGVKSVGMGIWQHWSYQMYSVIAMLFMSSNVIAAQHICINIVSMFHVIPIALAMAFSVYVGNMIGAKRIREAREYVKLSVIIGSLWGIICGLIMVTLK